MSALTPPKYAAIFERQNEGAKLRETLLDFATWLLKDEAAEGRVDALVDSYLGGR